MKLPHQLGIHQTLNKPTLVTRWTKSERYEAPSSFGHTSNPEHTNTTRERNCILMRVDPKKKNLPREVNKMNPKENPDAGWTRLEKHTYCKF
jgi:hypothetical protein